MCDAAFRNIRQQSSVRTSTHPVLYHRSMQCATGFEQFRAAYKETAAKLKTAIEFDEKRE